MHISVQKKEMARKEKFGVTIAYKCPNTIQIEVLI